jgi:hypothetical protein
MLLLSTVANAVPHGKRLDPDALAGALQELEDEVAQPYRHGTLKPVGEDRAYDTRPRLGRHMSDEMKQTPRHNPLDEMELERNQWGTTKLSAEKTAMAREIAREMVREISKGHGRASSLFPELEQGLDTIDHFALERVYGNTDMTGDMANALSDKVKSCLEVPSTEGVDGECINQHYKLHFAKVEAGNKEDLADRLQAAVATAAINKMARKMYEECMVLGAVPDYPKPDPYRDPFRSGKSGAEEVRDPPYYPEGESYP